MNIHQNARLTPLSRERVVREVVSGQTPEAAAQRPFQMGDRPQIGSLTSACPAS